MGNLHGRWLAASAAIVCIAVATPAVAQSTSFDIPAQPLSRSIQAFARQAGVQLLATFKTVRGKQSNAVRGTYSVDEGLKLLLKGTGLEAVPDPDRSGIITIRARAVIPAATPPTTMPAAAVPAPPRTAAGGRESQAGSDKETPPGDIVVTGSRILRANDTSPGPVATLSSQEAKFQGTTHVEDLLNSLPQVNAGLNGAALGPTGTATVDLRGFGAFRTLVLMNGRRLNPGDPINPSADLNAIPAPLVKRVEVLTGGASSIYGSDAVAGVVNFIMDTDFKGFQVDAQYGVNQHDNRDRTLQQLARDNGITPASGNKFDGGTVELSATYGTNFDQSRGHVTAYAGYRRTVGILGRARDSSACPLNETSTGTAYECILDSNTMLGSFQANGGDILTLDPATGNSFRLYDNARDGYNVAPFQSLQRPDRRVDFGLFANYRLSKAAELYFEGQYSDDKTTAIYEPSSTALNSFNVNCDNPLLSASQITDLCTAFGLAGTDLTSVTIGRRNVEGSPRLDAFRHRSLRLLLGMKGQIDRALSYDVYVNYGIARSNELVSNDFSLTRLANALNVVNVGGTPTCAAVVDHSDPACVPYNIFRVGGATPAALAYVSANGAQHGSASHVVLSGAITGNLGEYGIRSPLANEGVGLAVGVEYRAESIANSPDPAFVNADLAVASPQLPVAGTYHVTEIFGELHVPLIQDRPGFDKLSLELSDRYAKYSLQGVANSYNVGLEWAPVKDIRFRSSLSQAIRAPNGHELFTATTISKFGVSDPCAGVAPAADAAHCANSGVTAQQYGTIVDTGNFNFLTGGNLNLRPEIANTLTAGVVITPSWLPHFSFSVDYWRIKVKGYVGQYAPNATLTDCVNTGDPLFCSLVHRDATGSLSIGNGPTAGRVIATNLNTGSSAQSGIDLSGNYSLGLGAAGRLVFNFGGSVALNSRLQIDPTQPAFDCTGLYGPTCTGEGPTSPIPRWRHQLRLTWKPRGTFDMSLNWRHIGALDSELGSPYPHLQGTVFPIDARISPYDYFDLATSVDVLHGSSLRVGVNNIFDRNAPIVGANNNPQILGGNMVASIYDTLGRYIFVGITVKF